MKPSRLALLVVSLLVTTHVGTCLDDLIAEESQDEKQVTELPPHKQSPQPKKYSSRIRASDAVFGQKTSPKKTVLDFRIEPEGLKASAAGAGKGKSDDEEEKTLAQQVADGKYGLIQNELFPAGSKRPGIISYSANPEVPKDTSDNLGGLDKEEIWLAEDHVLVLRGGGFPQYYNDTVPTPWKPIDDYIAPPRQVEIPKNPKIPPPFPVQLSDNEPLQFIRGENGSQPPPPPFFPPFPLPPLGGNGTPPYPVPPGPSPPFLPPGAAFLPPPGNFTDFDEDDPSIYYPPKYDFHYPQDNTTAVPPGPLVPGIILPPPPNFFTAEKPNDEENETELDDVTTKKAPFIGPAYLPSKRLPYKPRPQTKRPPTEAKTAYPVYTERPARPTIQSKFTSPIYVPNMTSKPIHVMPITSPRPNHISIPKNKTLKQDIYIISTQPPDVANDIIDIIRDTKPTKTTSLEGISPERHPLRSLIRPQVSVNYIGKVGHLPPSTAFPFPRTEPTPTDDYQAPHGHFITFPPSITVTPVPVVKKIQLKPTETPKNPQATFFFYEEPTTPANENYAAVSPIDQFIRDNFGQDDIDYDLKGDKQPVYIPARSKPKPRPKPSYVPVEDPQKLNALEYDSPGLAGLPTLPPPTTVSTFQPPQQHHNVQSVTDGPFIPSNYYATANPATMHFTKFDPTIVDDITMKYFTIFGKKLNAGTTPITPSTPTTPRSRFAQSYTPSTTSRPKINSYSTTTRSRIPYAYTSKTTTTESPRFRTLTTAQPPPYKPVHQANQANPPQSHFEQFLQEITGEDQNDYVVTHQTPVKVKKPKSRPIFNEPPRDQHYYEYLPSYNTGGLSDYFEGIYRQSPSTTTRPVSDLDLQYQPSPSTTQRPFIQSPTPLSHNHGQYLQEVTYTRPRAPGSSNLEFFAASAQNPVRQQFQKPVSLESDVLVNYRRPLPPINPDAEILPTSYSSSNSNIQVVQAPDLARPNQQYQGYQPRPVYENVPQPGFFGLQQPTAFGAGQTGFGGQQQFGQQQFGPPQLNPANAYVSYNLPDNGGHYYFLTPHGIGRSDTDVDQDDRYGPVKRSDATPEDRLSHRSSRDRQATARGDVSTSQEYLRRRRKKS